MIPLVLLAEPPMLVLPGTIMVTCKPFCGNKLKGSLWLFVLVITMQPASTVMNQGAADAMSKTVKYIFVN